MKKMKMKLMLIAMAIGAIATVTANAQIFTEDFDATSGGTAVGGQDSTGLNMTWGGNVPGWSKWGSWAAISYVDLGASDLALMFFENDGLLLDVGIAANDCGTSYEVEFDYGTAAWTAGFGTDVNEGLLVEVLRGDYSVLASDTFLPGAWGVGNYNLDAGLTGTLAYEGDDSGDVFLRIQAVDTGYGYAASIDNLTVSATGSNFSCHEPTDGDHIPAENIAALTYNVPDPIGAGPVTCTVVYGTNGTETIPGILDVAGNSTDTATTGTVAYAPGVGDHYWQIMVTEPSEATYYSPVHAFSIVEPVIYTPDQVLFTEDFALLTGTVYAGSQADTGLAINYLCTLTGWSPITFGIDDGSDWAPMLFHNSVITSDAVVAKEPGQSYKLTFDYGTATWSASQVTSASDGLLVEVLNPADTVLAQDTFMPGAWGVGNYNLDAGLQGTLIYTGDGSSDVRIRISSSNPASGRFGGSIDNLSLSVNTFNHMPSDGPHYSTENITELTHFIPDPNGSGPVTCTVVYGTDGTESSPGILSDAGGNFTDTASTGTVAYAPALGDHFWQIIVTEPGEPTYESPIYAFSIVNQPPVAIIGGPILDGTAYHTWTPYNAEDVNAGVPINIFIYDGGSHDPDGDDGALTYEWTILERGTSNPVAVYAFDDPTAEDPNIEILWAGVYDLRLTVTDEDGGTGTTTAADGIFVDYDPCRYVRQARNGLDYMYEGENLNPYTDQLADFYDARDNGVNHSPSNWNGDCYVDVNELEMLAGVWLQARAWVDTETDWFGIPGALDPNTSMSDMSILSAEWGTDMLLTAPDYYQAP